MQQTVGQGVCEELQSLIGIVTIAQHLTSTFEHLIALGLATGTQSLQRALVIERLQPVHVVGDLQINDRLGFERGLLARAQGFLDQFADVIDGVQIDIFERTDVLGDIARHRQIEHEHRSMFARLQCGAHLLQIKNRRATRGRGDDDVGVGQMCGQIGQWQGLRAVLLGQRLRIGEGAIGHQHAMHAGIDQVACGQFDGVAGADQQYRCLAQIGKDLARETHGSECHRHRTGADAGFRARSLGDRKRILEQAIERGVDTADIDGYLVGDFELAKNLRLTEYHRIEPGGDAEHVARGVSIAMLVQIAFQSRCCQPEVFVQPVGQCFFPTFIDMAVKFGAIAGRQNRRFPHAGYLGQCAECIRGRLAGERNLLAQGKRGGLVVESERDERHGMTKYYGRAFWARWFERSRKLPLKSLPRWTMPFCLLVLAACASQPSRDDGLTARALDPLSLESGDMLLSERISAEFSRQSGDETQRLEHLLKAAEASEDPLHTKTALRAALVASDNQAATAMLARFTQLAPDSAEPRAWAVALALHMGRSEDAWALTHSDQLPAIENRQLGEALAAVPVRERVLPFIERTIEASDDLTMSLRWCSFVRRINEPDLALILVSRLIERFPDQSSALAWRAQLKRELKDMAGARTDFSAALLLDPESRFLRLSLAQLEDADGESAAAARRVASIQPADDLVVQAQVAYAARSKDKALLSTAYTALQALPKPRPALRLQMLGTVAERLGDRAAAIDWLRQMPDGPEQAEAWLRAAVLLNESADSAGALKLLRAVRSKPGVAREALVSSYLIEGHVLRLSGEQTAARDLYSAALSLVPDDVQLLYARGLEYAELEQTAEAEADFRRLLAIEPEHADGLNALGYTLADQTRRYAEALALIEKALQLKPGDGAILDSLGWVKLRMGAPEQAIEHLRAAHAVQQDAEISAHLGEALWAGNQREEAQKVWREARQREPENPVLIDTLRRHGL